MGSVKDLTIIEAPDKERSGRGRFFFSDRYSVFDWGKMPDDIQNKGASLCIISAYLLEKLEEMGIKTHYLGVVEDNEVKKLMDIKTIPTSMEVSLVRVIKPQLPDGRIRLIRRNDLIPSLIRVIIPQVPYGCYDYSCYNHEQANFLIPLEVIYRNYLPEGSSVFKRLSDGQLTIKDMGLTVHPVPGQKLDNPMLDFSTKLETIDRYINPKEAKTIAGLSEHEFQEILRITGVIDNLISEETCKIGLVNEDGKVEFGFDADRQLILVDVLGTPDECRFTFEGLPVSKEVARIFYRNTAWFRDIEKAKKMSSIYWKEMVYVMPEPLPSRLCELISMLYQAVANEMTGRVWFNGVPGLREILKEIKLFL
ncbi:phosphoribosylaminoimidazolesuccinocarboxamide synthase [Candidatus Desantisbacteria bacterium CG2_30_40_21]|uniref:Phosphoribosylaminoimidazole-succinocarboxamide synthase n=5 Tax=unclassified Candidatus Desantisiibacteriota TaxID=3106372 RepID=A0A2M7JCY5_9BACT|nr:MAG: phosphoribosylaminoimidazolesuccinocarboxamide synthase [Candidatus Desantisbacteria bacterium CG2_30_40_21]PIP41091.1 MAG: phosphoribosylaminoimidazolesuccinocarboxamide synthase [Candidatus Desantisbacteria bacterium CG23_combo_of_CG06-09_8_20_14_all_40_23]PIX17282.1 MAG: phosphoribosylaminoimidazolesuccinocarboxamide synthase [Candidatus Desantisbacteria bacterium CG_4_8_14_3_um_filter_40_12]PIY18539.1 MAG: phosphoribosylaminoimidazolesuccinocarboxamide synthase [Candidatus Desantisba